MPWFLDTLSRVYREQLERYHNRHFLNAAMAACAVVAMADGTVSFRQRIRVDQVMETLDALKVYDPHEGVDLFNQFVAALLDSPEDGRARAIAAISDEVSQDPEKAALLIRICIAVSEVDGRIPSIEQSEIEALCQLLEVNPEHCDFGSPPG